MSHIAPMKSKSLYYAVNGSGQGVVFTSPPVRDDRRKIWIGDMNGVYGRLVMQLESEELISLPIIKWDDKPVLLELNMRICSEEPL